MGSFWTSPFVVPLGAFVVAIVAIVSGMIGREHSRRIKAEQRLAMLARGIPIAEIEAVLNAGGDTEERPPSSPLGRMANSRRAAMVLISVGIGVVLLGICLTAILQEREVMSVAAAGLVPLAIGFGFLVDYNMQKKELSHFGLMNGGDKSL